MSKKKKVVECITADVPTQNGRVYSRGILEKMVKDSNDKVSVLIGPDLYLDRLMIKDVLGEATDFELNEEGNIAADVNMLPRFESLLDACDFSPVGHGSVDADGRITDFNISYFALTPKEKP